MNLSHVIPLVPDQTAGIELVGGKGYNLLRLMCAGLPVPGGFVITTSAYRTWIAGGRTWPPDLTAQIQESYAELGSDCLVAVRSSGTSEDLRDASFAGGHETVLNVSGWNDLQPAVEKCWASLQGDRVRAYRSKLGVGEQGLSIAVVIQRMVRARVSGVVFTAEPVSGDRDTLALDACAGLGEGLVSGQVTPEHYELRRKDLSVVKVGNKAGLLSKKQVHKIALCALEIERRFGCAQDIEWSIDQAGDLNILQARPITTVSAVRWMNPTEGAVWVRRGAGGLAEYLPTAVTPLYATAQLPRIMEHHDAQCAEMGVASPLPGMALINGHFYSRQDYKLGLGALRLPLSYWRAGRGAARKWRDAAPTQIAALKKLQEFNYTLTTDTELVSYLNRILDYNAAAWDQAARASRGWEVGEPVFKRIFQSLIKPVTGGDAVTFLRGFDSQTLASEQGQIELLEAAKRSADVTNILRLYSGQEALAKLQETVGGRDWLEKLTGFCRQFGHVTANHDYYCASPADDPAKALDAIRARLDLATSNPLQRQVQMAAERKRTEAETFEKLESFPIRRAIFGWGLAWAQEAASIREDVFFSALAGWPLARRVILEIGKRLVRRGALESADDVFFLTWNELSELSSNHGRIGYQRVASDRRTAFHGQVGLVPPPVIPVSGPPRTASSRLKARVKSAITGASRPSSRNALHGSPVSPGRVTGPARILVSAADAWRLQAGDIVVTRAATPDWTPTFSIAAALVTDTGGPLSHCSIIAREFGIPAVMGVQAATQTISEGQIITVDGAEGVVHLHVLEDKHENTRQL
jgi:rifampicin phosphotransferase